MEWPESIYEMTSSTNINTTAPINLIDVAIIAVDSSGNCNPGGTCPTYGTRVLVADGTRRAARPGVERFVADLSIKVFSDGDSGTFATPDPVTDGAGFSPDVF